MTAPYNPSIALPTKPQGPGASKVQGQASRRFTDTLWDNHKSARFPRGRPFTGEREYAATPEMGHHPGFISGDLQQIEMVTNDAGIIDRAATFATQWSAPWLPHAKYFKFNYQRKLITFAYDKGIADERESLDKYYRAAAKLSGANGWGAIEFGVMPNYQITALLGEPSIYLPIFQAAQAGDPWLLGHIDEPNEKLAAILGLNILFNSRDAQVGGLSMRAAAISAPQRPQGVVTPDQVLATPTDDLMKMVAEIAAQAAAAAVGRALDEREQQTAEKSRKNKERMQKVRASRKQPGPATVT